MKQIPSTQFQKQYPRLTEAHQVTVLGRVIGTWTPISAAVDTRHTEGIRPGEPVSPGAQEFHERSGFGSSSPAPKPGKKK